MPHCHMSLNPYQCKTHLDAFLGYVSPTMMDGRAFRSVRLTDEDAASRRKAREQEKQELIRRMAPFIPKQLDPNATLDMRLGVHGVCPICGGVGPTDQWCFNTVCGLYEVFHIAIPHKPLRVDEKCDV